MFTQNPATGVPSLKKKKGFGGSALIKNPKNEVEKK